MYLRLIHQLRQASSHHSSVGDLSTPCAHGGTETTVPSARLRPQQHTGARAVQEQAQGCPFCAEGQGPAAGERTAVGLTNLPGTRNPRRWPKQGSVLPSPSPYLHGRAAAVCSRTTLPTCSGDPMSLLTPCRMCRWQCWGGTTLAAGVGLCQEPHGALTPAPALDRALQRWRAGQCQEAPSGVRAVSGQ